MTNNFKTSKYKDITSNFINNKISVKCIIIFLVSLLILTLASCNINSSDELINSNNKALYKHDGIKIDEFINLYNTYVTEDAFKIKELEMPLTGVSEYTFENGCKISLGMSPNEENFVYIPQIFTDTCDISSIPHFEEIVYGVLKVYDSTIAKEQAKKVVEEISYNEWELKVLESDGLKVEETTVNDIEVRVIYSFEDGAHIYCLN